MCHNASGLGQQKKRLCLFQYFRDNKADVVFLQEVHREDKLNSIWQTQWKNRILFANGQSNAKGVAIMLSKQLAPKVTEVIRDENGRFILCKLEQEESSFCLANIYAPNDQEPSFLEKISKKIEDMSCTFTILGGDFNTALCAELDRNSKVETKQMSLQAIKSLMEGHELIDIWRELNVEKKTFTCVIYLCIYIYDQIWKKVSWSRIDYFLIMDSMRNWVKECVILPGILSDHSILSLSIEV